MSKQIHIIERTYVKHDNEYKSYEIIDGKEYYVIFYDGRPVNIKIIRMNSFPFYHKMCFINKGFAIRLAKKLNKIFKTDKFEVWKVKKDEKVEL